MNTCWFCFVLPVNFHNMKSVLSPALSFVCHQGFNDSNQTRRGRRVSEAAARRQAD